jgi:predicted ATPase
VRHLIPGVRSLDVERTKEGFLRLIVDESGIIMSSRLISEGTLRILGLLAITNPIEPLGVVGYEEPENGVHPRRLSIVARILSEAAERGSTQFIINTHSPVLPEFFLDSKIAKLVACRKEGRVTKFDSFETEGPLFQLKEIEAALDEPQTPLRDRLIRGDFGG